MFHVPRWMLRQTFDQLRTCGHGRRECQILWTSSWNVVEEITGVVHPKHRAHVGGFEIDSNWLTAFWLRLAERNEGVRVQIHTHPGEAFHSQTDDAFPIVHTPGFLSLVIPRFAQGDISFDGAFLAELKADGHFQEVRIPNYLRVVG